MLTRNGESGSLCLVSDPRVFGFPLLGTMLAAGLSYMAFVMLSNFPFLGVLFF